MKKIILGMFVLATSIAFFGCSTDNNDGPDCFLTGRIQYNGENIGVQSTEERTKLEIRQPSYPLSEFITVYVQQDGTFSAKLHKGTYVLAAQDKTGPWENTRDQITIDLNGSKSVDYPVKPFVTISNFKIEMDGDQIKADFDIKKIATDDKLDYISLVLSGTQFVDEQHQKGYSKIEARTGADRFGHYTITDNFKTGFSIDSWPDMRENLAKQRELYCRVAVFLKDTDRPLYTTQVVKIR